MHQKAQALASAPLVMPSALGRRKGLYGVRNGCMAKRKRKLTLQEKVAKERFLREYMIIFINGKQKRVKRPELVEGMSAAEFIHTNADQIWLHQNEMWEDMEVDEEDE
jgi:hypothetical protein